MRLCAAQFRPSPGAIAANTSIHLRLMHLALACRADAVWFPELSLTGYEPALAQTLALEPEDPRLAVFQAFSDRHGLTAGIGAPVRAEDGIRIGMLLFRPGLPRLLYCKQMLHADELPWFTPGSAQLILELGGLRIAPAICYESLQPAHSEQAHALGAACYAASVAKSQQGVDRACRWYPELAARFAMPVLMANCTGPCDTFESAGGSAAWNAQGRRLASLDSRRDGLVVYDTETDTAEGVYG
ncbi:MAG: carbon-nitrogen hydrolase family protein [Bacteroidia bacterium]|nr:carbon-nitrogen hydrolase family protein [Bacteroidia bacterium]